MMQSAKKLILVDECDREYKRLQRPTNAVAKTKHSLEVSNTLRDSTLADDQKVREYVAALHRYLNLRKTSSVRSNRNFVGSLILFLQYKAACDSDWCHLSFGRRHET